uniref:Uncharacterized protein n=1 Tax=Cacopsylla melanoneura TaxID=428564 RepID=A0A8D8TDZ0_9HEMI
MHVQIPEGGTRRPLFPLDRAPAQHAGEQRVYSRDYVRIIQRAWSVHCRASCARFSRFLEIPFPGRENSDRDCGGQWRRCHSRHSCGGRLRDWILYQTHSHCRTKHHLLHSVSSARARDWHSTRTKSGDCQSH